TFFHLSAKQIAEGTGRLVDVIKSFLQEKQGYIPEIILVSPPEIGSDISSSPFYGDFSEDAIGESKKFPKNYKAVADEKGCRFLDAAKYIYPSEVDSLHLTVEGHRILAEKLYELIQETDHTDTSAD
ncbi:MAG: acylhydrolase, partial [Lachnospiraceae bacterium]|nr:acylhydrolase [Lachnospiraceae bacterium]